MFRTNRIKMVLCIEEFHVISVMRNLFGEYDIIV